MESIITYGSVANKRLQLLKIFVNNHHCLVTINTELRNYPVIGQAAMINGSCFERDDGHIVSGFCSQFKLSRKANIE